MKEGEESDMGFLGILEPATPGIPGARLRAHEGEGSRDPSGIGWDGERGRWEAGGMWEWLEEQGKGLSSWAEHPH